MGTPGVSFLGACHGEGSVMYAVAAASQRDVPRLPARGHPPEEPHQEPCGVRHAVATVFALPAAGVSPAPASLCGAAIRGWRIFPDVTFDPAQPAACQRCAQLVSYLSLQQQFAGPNGHRRPAHLDNNEAERSMLDIHPLRQPGDRAAR